MQKAPVSRVTIIFVVVVLLYVGLILGLFFRQVLSHKKYLAQAQQQQGVRKENQGERGKIYLRQKESDYIKTNQSDIEKKYFPMAVNIDRYEISVVPKNVKEKERAADELSGILEIDCDQLLQELQTDKLYLPPLKKRQSKEIADKVLALNFAGVYVTAVPTRYYPEDDLASQVIGFVNFDGDGVIGIEKYYDEQLKGRPGVVEGLHDTKGRMISVNTEKVAQDGVSMVLTLDQAVQFMAEKKLEEAVEKYGADSGSIIIMDPLSGAVLAMANRPAFNLNTFNELSEDEHWLFVNTAVSNIWEPGSVFKPIFMAAAVDSGKVEPDTKPEPPGFSNFVVVDGYEIHNSTDTAYGVETMMQVLERSDNIGMIWVADKFEDDGELAKYLNNFGFGRQSGIDLISESAGKVLPPDQWRRVNKATMSFGQGISVTPLQLVNAFAVLANGGKWLKPHIVDRFLEPGGTEKVVGQEGEPPQVISPETADKIAGMMVSVVENGHGKKAAVSGFRVAGKTGTAQIPAPEGGYLEGQHIGSFCGFAPAFEPKFVMCVKLDRPKNVEWAESSAAPTFGELADWLLNSYFKLTPTEPIEKPVKAEPASAPEEETEESAEEAPVSPPEGEVEHIEPL